jgi:CubicO group peptidase (beta-lactamase class C family)
VAVTGLEEGIDALMAAVVSPDAPGAAIGVIQDGRFVHRKGYGLADLEWSIPMRPDCVFRIASLTKQFTAVAAMMLAERGALSIDDPVVRHLPQWPWGRRVTIAHLLSHTSGIWPHDREETARVLGPFAPVEDEVRLICERDPVDEPGSTYRYNNGGYVLLGALIERASGRSFGDFLREAIFKPLGMRQTSLLSDRRVTPLRARGYAQGRGGFFYNPRPDLLDYYRAAGGLGSSVDDLALWDRALREDRLIRRETLERMLAPTPLNDGSSYPYGFGWGLTDDYLGDRIFHHAGGLANGFACQMLHWRDEALATIVLANRYLFPFDRVSRGLARILKDRPYEPPPILPVSEQQWDACVGRYDIPGRGMVEIERGGAFASLATDRMCDPADPEVEFRFSEACDGRFRRLDYLTPLFPPQTYRRADDP